MKCKNGILHLEGQYASTALRHDFSQANISMEVSYIGPNYDLPQDNLKFMQGSYTYEHPRGGQTIKWMDGLGTTHTVRVGNHKQVHVVFPIENNSWEWLSENGWERTDFNEACKWVHATFRGMP